LTTTGNSERYCRNCETINPDRLWGHQAQYERVRQLLAPIYSWFTEGFDTDDLQGVKALLEALR
jgi:hypothetical protein